MGTVKRRLRMHSLRLGEHPMLRLSAIIACLLATVSGAPAQAPANATAIFAGGCFWCVEADFDKVAGVVSTTSGYIGGGTKEPTYPPGLAGGTRPAPTGGKSRSPPPGRQSQLLRAGL